MIITMEEPSRASVFVICDCGAEIELQFTAIDKPFDCPSCGNEQHLEESEIAKATAGFGKALMEAARQVAEGADRGTAVVRLRDPR